jgi:hypothetical protein
MWAAVFEAVPENDVRLHYPKEMVPEGIIGCAIVLGHEFGHVLDEDDEYEEPGTPDAGSRTPPPNNNNVSKNENSVRAYFQVPLGKTYHGYGPIPAPN